MLDDASRIEIHKQNIVKYIDRLYQTTSVNAESQITEDMIKEASRLNVNDLAELAKTLDVFGKCVLHYKLPIDTRMDVGFAKASEVHECDRLLYWKEYKEKLKAMNKGPEEEYDKIILMACTLHVPINPKEQEPSGDEIKSKETVVDNNSISSEGENK